jgi:hypothetical protein
MIKLTGMEYTDGAKDLSIMESKNRIRLIGKDISGGQMEMNIGESTRIT